MERGFAAALVTNRRSCVKEKMTSLSRTNLVALIDSEAVTKAAINCYIAYNYVFQTFRLHTIHLSSSASIVVVSETKERITSKEKCALVTVDQS